jgi:hypothetical protein
MFKRRKARQAKQLRAAQTARRVLAARATCLEALHVADNPHDVARVADAISHVDLALDTIEPRLGNYAVLRQQITDRSPAV